jgi:hypothetical protein
MFHIEKEREDEALRNKMLIEYRKLDILRAMKDVHVEVI